MRCLRRPSAQRTKLPSILYDFSYRSLEEHKFALEEELNKRLLRHDNEATHPSGNCSSASHGSKNVLAPSWSKRRMSFRAAQLNLFFPLKLVDFFIDMRHIMVIIEMENSLEICTIAEPTA